MTPERAIAPRVSCIHEAFERMVEHRSAHTAVVCGDEQWSYTQLNAESNRIAHALIALGVEREEPVAIALPRSCEHIAAMLGVLKAGAAYVPIVDNQPVPRLSAMLKDSGARFMIGREGHLAELHEQVERVLTRSAYQNQPDTNPPLVCDPSDLAYILYTSGSTGEPKGVMIEHDGVHRLVHDQWFLPTGEETNYLCVSSFGFDASTIEVYATLLHGATLVMTTRRVPEPDEVRELIEAHDVRAAWIAFGFFGALFESDPGMFERVETIMTGGEPVHAELIRRAQCALPNTKFVNSYGPTECTALSTAYEIPVLGDDSSGMLPIGRALRGMCCEVVDANGKPVGVGGEGELLISGIGITRGYLNAPEQTSRRVIVDEDGHRTFRSGDLVRVQSDGNLMFLGRIDAQVKLRGNRFELGEVESIARTVPGVDACVACIVGGDRHQELALLVSMRESSWDPERIRSHLEQQVPEYMVPARIERCDSIPLTRNGKADRSRAREMIEESAARSPQTRAGTLLSETERALAGIMTDVLGVEITDREDRFLELGGHSLRALILCAKIADRFNARVQISSIYTLGCVREIADEIDRITRGDQIHDDVIHPAESTEPAPLSFNQLRLWMHDQIHPGDPSYTITMRLDHDGVLDRHAFEAAWEAVCDRHRVLRSHIQIVGDEPCMIVGPLINCAPIWVDDQDLDAITHRESTRGFDLETGPLVRCLVVSHARGAAVIITMHHIISDAWSCSILQRELADAYQQICETGRFAASPLRVQYADYARWERTLPDRASYTKDLQAWQDELRGAPVLRLPADHPHGSGSSNAGIREELTLDPETASRVRDGARSLGVTPFVFMLGAFNAWLSRLTLSEDIVIGTPVANRRSHDAQSLIGFFMETLPLRNRVPEGITVRELVDGVNQTSLRAFDRRDVPFQHIVESLGGQGADAQNPLFEVFFNHIAIPLRSDPNRSKVLDFSDHEIDNHTAKFDLTCYVFEDDTHTRVVFNARRSRFSSHTIRWYHQQFVSLLTQFPELLDTPIRSIPMDDTPIPGINPARIPAPQLPPEYTTSGSICERIERIVKAHPRRIAAQDTHRSISYAELWDRSASLGNSLTKLGVTKGDRVLIATDDPIDTCIATLATLRVGGVFVPTDPHWPTPRFQQIADSAKLSAAVVSHDDHHPSVTCPCFVVDQVPNNPQPLNIHVHPDDPAYLMYTSGSTGKPKGVLQSHRGVVGHMMTLAHALELHPGDKLLQLSSFAFDASIMDMFSCWMSGATLCVADARTQSPAQIGSWINQSRVSILHAAPTLFRWFCAGLDEETTLDSVRAVILGGEHASDHDIDQVLSHCPSCALMINGFGLTESSLNFQYRIDPRMPIDWPARLPIGYPVEGVRARLVDGVGNPAFPTGEIEIDSDRIALAYTNPVAPLGSEQSVTGTKRFRTGDLGTIRHDGSVMHLGRIDDQAQINGCRVEPNEVASVLLTLKMIKDAAVLVDTHEGGSSHLRAFVVCDDSCSIEDLTSACAQVLPSYMIPSVWTRVDSIPRVGGGKIDRQALRVSATLGFASDIAQIGAPVDAHTEQIMLAFHQVLGSDRIGPDDHFFHHGGNSLRAIQLFAKLREQMQTELPISVIYRASTPRLLSRAFDSHRGTPNRSLIELNTRAPDRPRIIVLPGIGGHPLGFGPLIDRVTSDAHFVGVQYPDETILDEIGRSLPALASWVIDQLELDEHDPIPDMIGYSFGGSLAMEIAMQLRRDHHPHGRLLLLDAHLPFGLPQRGRFGKARVHLARIVEGHETSRIAYIAQRLRPNQPDPQQGADERRDELDAYRAVSRINRQMVLDYRPSTTYDGAITLVRARQPEWLRFHRDDGHNGFSAIVDPSRIERIEIDAGHLELFNPDPATQIARVVDRWIGQP